MAASWTGGCFPASIIEANISKERVEAPELRSRQNTVNGGGMHFRL